MREIKNIRSNYKSRADLIAPNKTHIGNMKETKDSSYTKKVFFRATFEQSDLIKRAAKQDNQTVSGWLRNRAMRMARKELQTDRSTTI